MPIHARLDSLLALDDMGTALELAGPAWARVPFVPHDDVMRVTPDGQTLWRVALPPYVTPPGLAVAPDAATVYVVIDSAVLALSEVTGRVQARFRLDMQALGWPAAVVAGTNNRLYLVGQPARGYAALVEALEMGTHPRVVWRARLGLFHAGIWLGAAQATRLAVYVPGTYDAPGDVNLLDERSGAVQRAYATPASPLAADPTHNRLYLAGAGTIRVLTLDSGRPIARISGHAPLVVIHQRGLVAFANADGVTLATASALRPVAHITAPAITALAASHDGATLLLGLNGALDRVRLAGCRA